MLLPKGNTVLMAHLCEVPPHKRNIYHIFTGNRFGNYVVNAFIYMNLL